jgi:hypothetical protein
MRGETLQPNARRLSVPYQNESLPPLESDCTKLQLGSETLVGVIDVKLGQLQRSSQPKPVSVLVQFQTSRGDRQESPSSGKSCAVARRRMMALWPVFECLPALVEAVAR